jgi:iron complex outermembrane receptor protein
VAAREDHHQGPGTAASGSLAGLSGWPDWPSPAATERAARGSIINIARSKVDGGEGEGKLQWKPLAGLSIGQSLGDKHAVLKDFNSPLLGNSQAQLRRLRGLDLKPAGDYSYRSTYPSWLNRLNVDGGNICDIPAYWLANARLEIAPFNSPWQATVSYAY